jgi:hypothetical protein
MKLCLMEQKDFLSYLPKTLKRSRDQVNIELMELLSLAFIVIIINSKKATLS